MKLLRTESYRRGIIFSIALNIISKGLAFLSSIIIAYYFGVQFKTDIYFYCLSTIGLLVGFIGSLDSTVIIPESMRLRELVSESAAKSFLNIFLYLYIVIGLLIVLILVIDPLSIIGNISNFNLIDLRNSRDLILMFIPIFFLILISTYLTNVLTSFKYFTLPILASIINNLFSLIFLFSFHDILDVRSLALGLGIGYLINIMILVLLMKFQLNWKFDFRRFALDKRLKKNIQYAFSGNITSMLSGYAPLYILSNFNSGAMTMFNYAKNLSEVPNQMITAQFSNIAGIKFNELAAKNELNELDELFMQLTSFLLFLMTSIFGVIYLFADDIIAILYHRGAFDFDAVTKTAYLLKSLSFCLIYFVINTMVSRLFMAAQKLKESFWYQIYMNIISISITGLFSYFFGLNGFVLGTVLYQAIVIVSTYWLMKRSFSYIHYLKTLKGLVAAIFFNGCLVFLFELLLNGSILTIFQIATNVTLYFLLILCANYFFQIDKTIRQYCILFLSRIQRFATAFSNIKA